MYKIKDIPHSVPLFHSVIWEDIVDMVRDVVDQKNEQETEYTSNIVDQVIRDEFGEWELHPDIVYSEEGGTLTPDLFELQRRIDTVIGINAAYWRQYIESLKKAKEFDPLFNVDGTEIRTTVYGEHVTDKDYGARQKTDTLAPTQKTVQHGAQSETLDYGATSRTVTEGQRQDTNQYGAVSTTDGARSDSVTHGAQDVQHKESTMDNLTYRNKTQDATASYTDNMSKGSETTTTDQHSDTLTKGSQQNTDASTAHRDTSSAAAYSDTETTSQVINTSADSSAKDTETSKTHTDEETLRRFGNIGVTKSTDLLEANIEFGKRLRIVPIIANEIAKKLTIAAIWY